MWLGLTYHVLYTILMVLFNSALVKRSVSVLVCAYMQKRITSSCYCVLFRYICAYSYVIWCALDKIYVGFSVTKCNRAEHALNLLRKNRSGYDIVISEVHMPDMDGFKLLEQVGLEMDLPVISEHSYPDLYTWISDLWIELVWTNSRMQIV